MKINVDGIDINYICEGEGNPVIVLHGWGANIQAVLPIHNTLKDKFKVYTLDVPGFGESGEPKEVWGVEEFANCIKKFADKMNIKKAILIGHSHGGRISIMLGSKYPEFVKKIVLIDSAGIPSKKSFKYHMKVKSFKALKKMYTTIFFWGDKEKNLEKFYKKFGSTDYKNTPGIMRKVMVKVLAEDLREEMSKIKASTLIIWGREDTATPLYMGEEMKEKIKNSGLVVFDEAGHFSYADKYNLFCSVVNKFLEEDV